MNYLKLSTEMIFVDSFFSFKGLGAMILISLIDVVC